MAMIRQRVGPSRSDSVAPVRTNRRGRSLLRRTSLHRNQRSGVRPGARDYARNRFAHRTLRDGSTA